MKLYPFLIIFTLMVLTTSCETTMVPVTSTNDAPRHLSITVGDKVRVLTKYGDRPTFEVTEITETVLIGENHSIRYDDMAFVEMEVRVNAGGGSVMAVILLLVAGAVAVDSIGPIFQPGLAGAP